MPKSTPSVDQILAHAVDQARDALAPIAHEDEIGEHLGAQTEEERLVSHYFVCKKKGYRGWRWVATLARVPRGRKVTVCEVALVPGEDALLAPQWVPWAERLRPEDVKPGDTLPYHAHDERLETPQEDEGETARPKKRARDRVLSEVGQREAADRWYARTHPKNHKKGQGSAIAAHTCATCGFMIPLPGPMGTTFGVCANAWAKDDGSVIALDHTCGAHSETDIDYSDSAWRVDPLRVNDFTVEMEEWAREDA